MIQPKQQRVQFNPAQNVPLHRKKIMLEELQSVKCILHAAGNDGKKNNFFLVYFFKLDNIKDWSDWEVGRVGTKVFHPNTFCVHHKFYCIKHTRKRMAHSKCPNRCHKQAGKIASIFHSLAHSFGLLIVIQVEPILIITKDNSVTLKLWCSVCAQ